MVQSLRGVVITGTIGAGKTSLAEGVSGLLHKSGITHALLDLDWLGQLYPPPDTDDPYALDLAFKNLTAIAPNFIAAGARFFVMGATLVARKELDRLRAAIPQVELTVCRVTASTEVVAQRIRSREIGSLLDDFLARTDDLARIIEAEGMEDMVIANDGDIRAAASELFDRLGWRQLSG